MCLTIYPYLQSRIYKKQYKKFAEEKFNSIKDAPFEITFTSDIIHYKSKFSNVDVNTAQLNHIFETKDYFFIRLSSQDTISLPKRSFDYDALNSYLITISNKNSIPITREIDWRWK